MKSLYWIILALWCCINTIVQFWTCITSCNISQFLICLGTIAMPLIAMVALWYSRREYKNHREQTRISVLGQYNERYSTSPEINRVIAFLIDKTNNNSACVQETDKELAAATIRDRELFMRFFGELQIAIRKGLVDQKYAKVMFGYYAVEAANLGKEFVDDYDEPYWSLFREFAESMRQLDYNQCIKGLD